MISVARKKRAHFHTLKLFMKSTHPLENILHSIMKSLRVQLRGYQVSLFPQFSSPEQKTFCLLATKEQIYGERKRRNVTACGTQNICFIFFFFTETIQSPSTVSSKTNHALNNGFETRHYLEFSVLLFWGTICTIVIEQTGLVCVVLVWKHSKSGL